MAPDWRDLSWNADVYANTTVTFSACTALLAEDLSTCTPHVIASVTGGARCTTTADCSVGYCDTDIGVCQIARAGTCSTNSQCAINAYCDTSVGSSCAGRCVTRARNTPYLRPTLAMRETASRAGRNPIERSALA